MESAATGTAVSFRKLEREYVGTSHLINRVLILGIRSVNEFHGWEISMRSFIAACLASIVIAALGAVALDLIQEPAATAFTTQSVRL